MPFPPQYARARTKDIIASGEDVRARVRSLTLQLLDEGLDLKQVKNVVTEIMDGTAEAVKSSIPASQSNHLRQVYEGLSEALDATARAAGGAVKELQARGKTFKDKDLAKAASNLKDLEEGFFSTIGGVAEKFSGQVRAELTTLVDETRRAGEKIRPHVTDALKAADGNMLSVATDAAASAGKVARKAAVAALSGAGGLLQGLSDKVSGAKKASSKTAKKTTSKPAAKKASKPAPKKSSKKASPKPAAKKSAAKPTKKSPTKKPAAKKAAKKKGKR